MKALIVEKPGHLVVKNVPDPKMNDDAVLVRVITASVCNSTDYHIVHGSFDGDAHDYYPQILGHEVYGEIVRTGAKVKSLANGDKITMYSDSGALCEYVAFAPDSWPCWARIPDGISDRVGPLCEMLHGTYVGLVYPARLQDTDNVVFVGQGPIGLTAMQLARMHAQSISVVDFFSNRLNKARELGADYAYDRSKMSADDIIAGINKTTGGADVVFMCIDVDRSRECDAFEMATKALKVNGRLASVNVMVKNLNHRMNPAPLFHKNIRLQHELETPPMNVQEMLRVFDRGVRFVAEKKVNLETLITHETDYAGVKDMIEMCVHDPGNIIKVLVRDR